MMSAWIDKFVDTLLDSGLANPDTIEGCSEEDIAEIEKKCQLKLPFAYKLYLRKLGRKAGDFLGECLRTYPGILKYGQDKAKTLLAGTGYRLPDTAFVFVERYGCQFFFFDTSDGQDDPPVYRYFEGDKGPVKVADSLTAAFLLALEDDLNALDPSVNTEYRFAI